MNVTVRLLTCRDALAPLLRYQTRHYAVKTANPGIAGLGAKKVKRDATGSTKIKLEVESDPHKLVNYVCGANYVLGTEEIKLKPDNEYPDWLWSIHTGPPKRIQDYEPGSKRYLELLKKINLRKANRLRLLSKIKLQ